jgi:hypothetical protein
VLDVLFRGLKAWRLFLELWRPFRRPIDKINCKFRFKYKFHLYFFPIFSWSSKTWIRIRIHLKYWIRIWVHNAAFRMSSVRVVFSRVVAQEAYSSCCSQLLISPLEYLTPRYWSEFLFQSLCWRSSSSCAGIWEHIEHGVWREHRALVLWAVSRQPQGSALSSLSQCWRHL